MADYNIYIRTVGGGDGSGNPTQPFQTGGGEGGDNFEQQFISKTAAFASNPDNMLSSASSTAAGALSKIGGKAGVAGIVIAAVVTAGKISKQIYEKYANTQAMLSGDYRNINRYNNFRNQINLYIHPISTISTMIQVSYEDAIKNAQLEQLKMLTGGTILNSQYGRYL